MARYFLVDEFGDVYKVSSEELAKQLGEDYLVIDAEKSEVVLSEEEIKDKIDPIIQEWPPL